MTGGIIVTHAHLAEGLKEAAQMIVGPQENFEAVALLEGEGLEQLLEKVREVMGKMGTQDVVLFVDLFGATPCNASGVLCAEWGCPVAAGVSLPVILEFLTGRETQETDELLKNMEETAGDSFRIVRQKDVLEGIT